MLKMFRLLVGAEPGWCLMVSLSTHQFSTPVEEYDILNLHLGHTACHKVS